MRGKQRGFSPGAAARHSKYARVHTDFFPIFFSTTSGTEFYFNVRPARFLRVVRFSRVMVLTVPECWRVRPFLADPLVDLYSSPCPQQSHKTVPPYELEVSVSVRTKPSSSASHAPHATALVFEMGGERI